MSPLSLESPAASLSSSALSSHSTGLLALKDIFSLKQQPSNPDGPHKWVAFHGNTFAHHLLPG